MKISTIVKIFVAWFIGSIVIILLLIAYRFWGPQREKRIDVYGKAEQFIKAEQFVKELEGKPIKQKKQ